MPSGQCKEGSGDGLHRDGMAALDRNRQNQDYELS